MRAAFIPWVLGTGLIAAACGAPRTPAPPPPPSAPAPTGPSALLSLDALFAPDAVHAVQVSPDGRQLAWLDGQGRAWIAPLTLEAAAPLGAARLLADAAAEAGGLFRSVAWSESGAMVLLIDEAGGLFAAATDPAAPRVTALLRPGESLASPLLGLSPAQPDRVVVLVRQSGGRIPLIAIGLADGARQIVDRNTQGFSEFYLDGLNRPRVARQSRAAAGDRLYRLDDAVGDWRLLLEMTPGDALVTTVAAVSADGASALVLDSVGRSRAILVSIALETGEKTVLGQSAEADVSQVWVDPATRTAQAFAAEYLAPVVTPLSPTARDALAAIDATLVGDPALASRSRDDSVWIIKETAPALGGAVHVFDRRTRGVRKLMDLRPALEAASLAPMRPLEISTRDGQTLVAYLTLPIGADQNGDGRPDTPLPMVLVIRDPTIPRDAAAFRADHQWLANRGYAVLSVNYRGSVGFGQAFQALGAGAFGAGLQTDLEDALSWAVDAGVAAPGRLAALGAGLAGSAALSLAAQPQPRLACTAALAPVVEPLALPLDDRTPSAWRRFLGAGRTPSDVTRLSNARIGARMDALSGRVFVLSGPPQANATRALADALHAAQKPIVLVEPSTGGTPSAAGVRPYVDRFFAACLSGRFFSPAAPEEAFVVRLGAALLEGAPAMGLTPLR